MNMIPKRKMNKKQRKLADSKKRTTWSFRPTNRVVQSKKMYTRKRISRDEQQNE